MTILDDIRQRLKAALEARAPMRAELRALRLFNGFYEGCPTLAVDLYGGTLVAHDYRDDPDRPDDLAAQAVRWLAEQIPGAQVALVKTRRARDAQRRNGEVVWGERAHVDTAIEENGVRYALDLLMNRDASLYLDTRLLRAWARTELAGAHVLNTFAHTGSLGVAARAAPAARVLQSDLSAAFLDVARRSYQLNGFEIRRADFRAADFFDEVARLKREDRLFDAVFLDPPFFSDTAKGRVDLEQQGARLINKVKPLVGNEGRLIVVNNALFASGAEWMKQLEALCADGFISLERTVAVPEDFTGFASTRVTAPPVDPAPFNHSTKIAVLRVRRKDGRRAP